MTTAQTASPARLLDRAARGDESAFAEFYDTAAGPVLAIAAGILRDPASAEQVTREVLLEIWRKAGRHPAREGTMAWVLTIAHQRAVERVRYERGARGPAPQALEFAPLYELTELQRRSIVLAYYSGFTAREVSAALNTPIPEVAAGMRDGLLRLRAALLGGGAA
ncbi:RNA polymerase subunit sigma [Nocardia panacis]|uniref:RNA polymerase subunit sigma n=1 Tax=Nocardia panacis TaxID=2340916 RepID=A0A3A4JUM8_9NOCA|nr:sigma factor [Nocardia panacis]RJO69905.1 RNA polymerase subunit sigma [Nocardia panacis]